MMNFTRSTLIAFIILSSSYAFSAEDDVTFNGTVKWLSCSPSSVLSCGNGFCSTYRWGPMPGSGSFQFDLPMKRFRVNMGKWESLELVQLSKAELNKPLWIKFRSGTTKIGLRFSPTQMSGFSYSFAVSGPATNVDLAVEGGDTLIVAGGCANQPYAFAFNPPQGGVLD